MAEAPLRALVLSDGIVGHDRICLGVVAALRRRRTVEEAWIGVQETGQNSRRWDRLRARLSEFDRFWPGRFAFTDDGPSGLPRAEPGAPGRFDMVVAAGPSIGAATIALAKRAGARSVQFGFPKLPLVHEFDVLIRPDRARFGVTRGVSTLRPSEIDPDTLPPPFLGEGAPRRLAVLLGGDTKHYAFRSEDFATLASALHALSDIHVTVFNSRRTPEARFAAFVGAFAPGGERRDVVDFRAGGFRSNMEAYAADAVVVTADSMSMIAEAIAARRPTLIIRPDGYRLPKRDAAEIAAHVDAGHAAEMSFSAFAAGGWRGPLTRLTPLPYHPLDRLADVVLGGDRP